ncbi:MAG: hypothetical protein EOP48_01315 [Sphingobacteriales bacterium]|nr:MAG: hypothetical protein EOP48_01315 [Sphingobacteriales bacterium]
MAKKEKKHKSDKKHKKTGHKKKISQKTHVTVVIDQSKRVKQLERKTPAKVDHHRYPLPPQIIYQQMPYQHQSQPTNQLRSAYEPMRVRLDETMSRNLPESSIYDNVGFAEPIEEEEPQPIAESMKLSSREEQYLSKASEKDQLLLEKAMAWYDSINKDPSTFYDKTKNIAPWSRVLIENGITTRETLGNIKNEYSRGKTRLPPRKPKG